jgi:hypothetical protein
MSPSWDECIGQAESLLRESAQDAAIASSVQDHLRVIETLLAAQVYVAMAEAKRISP